MLASRPTVSDCPAINRIPAAGQHQGSTSALRTATNALVANWTGPKTQPLRPNGTELNCKVAGSIPVSATTNKRLTGRRAARGSTRTAPEEKTPVGQPLLCSVDAPLSRSDLFVNVD